MQSHYNYLMAYTIWANKKTLLAMEALEKPDKMCLKWFSHIISAQDIWLARLLNESIDDIPVWQEQSLEECQVAFKESHASWQKWLNMAQDHHFQDTCYYQTTTGESHQSRIGDIVTHVINHGTHHRGQILARLRELGQTPPSLDFIFWVRQTQS